MTTPPYIPSVPLWQKFIDPVHWEIAQAKFPEAPWRLYLKPHGNYLPAAWDYFQLAHQWIVQRAQHDEGQQRALVVRDLLELNALLISGNAQNWRKALRYRRPIFNYRTREEVLRVYDQRRYANEDGLSLRVDGFFPAGHSSIDFFGACRALHKASTQSSERTWRVAHERFRSALQPSVNAASERWQAYFLTRSDELIGQLQAVLKWYSQSARAISSQPAKSRMPKVRKLAVKMQRYVDISQFSLDGSGRTSKLIQDYVFLRFGYPPPKPVLFFAHGRAWENGTYLSLAEALQMAEMGQPADLVSYPHSRRLNREETERGPTQSIDIATAHEVTRAIDDVTGRPR